EFWRRWHISLSSWFRDYLYIPLGGSKGGNWMRIRNTFIIFLVSGFWHGANWTFIFWGGLNALFMVPLIWFKTNRKNIETVAQGSLVPNLREIFQMVLTFGLIVFAWIFFRAESISHAFQYVGDIFTAELFMRPSVMSFGLLRTIGLVALFMLIEWIGRENKYAIEKMGIDWSRPLRWTFYAFIILIIGLYMHTEETPFIYFQF